MQTCVNLCDAVCHLEGSPSILHIKRLAMDYGDRKAPMPVPEPANEERGGLRSGLTPGNPHVHIKRWGCQSTACQVHCVPCADALCASQEGSAPESAASPEAQAESQKVLAEVRASTPLLTQDQEQAAMERLLNKGTRSVSLPLI